MNRIFHRIGNSFSSAGRGKILTLVILAALAAAATARSDVNLPAVFGDHMVLQRDMKIPVWGMADPGEKVTVAIAGRKPPPPPERTAAGRRRSRPSGWAGRTR